jgi:hypothetical protein
VSAFGNEIPLSYRLTAAAVLAWLTEQGRLPEAVLYQRFFMDWAENIERRPAGYFADLLGSHRHTVRAHVDRMAEQGLVRVHRTSKRLQVELVFDGIVALLYGPSVQKDSIPALLENWSSVQTSVQIEAWESRAEIWRLPQVRREVNELTPCYVTLCATGPEFGTDLALTTTVYVFSRYVYSCINYNYLSPVQIDTSPSGQSEPPVQLADAATSSPPSVKGPKRTRRRGTPTNSFGFRWATKEQVLADPYYARIEVLHNAWCQALNLEYPLTNWRYAAWRQALVEQGYTEEQVLDAVPALKRDAWWLERASDPHDMFGSRPDRIERFFPGNAKGAPDRLARGTPSTDESFTF